MRDNIAFGRTRREALLDYKMRNPEASKAEVSAAFGLSEKRAWEVLHHAVRLRVDALLKDGVSESEIVAAFPSDIRHRAHTWCARRREWAEKKKAEACAPAVRIGASDL